VLVSSGGTVYGEAEKLPISETHPPKPISPYGVTKLTLENYAYLYAATHGLKFICVRPANAYGAGQKPFAGQGFISTAIASVMRGQPIKIFGQSGSVRDYIYVSDLAAGIVCALESGSLSETYNIGSGVGLSNMDVINAITPLLESTNCKLSVEHYPERTFDVKSNVLDATKIQQLTGWQPKVQFKDGLLFTLDWLKKNYG
jgi:UDP-glucose 4-epimerase